MACPASTGFKLFSIYILIARVVTLPTARCSHVFIKGGTVVNADREFRADVLMTDDIITAVGRDIEVPPDATIIDATGQYVMPGGIDPHTHMAMPFMGQETCDDFFSGQAAGLAGGTTMHIDFVLPVQHDLKAGLEAWKVKAERSCADYAFHMAVTNWNQKTSDDMADIVAEGINSFKFFMAYKGALMVNDDELLRGMQRCKELGALPMVHAENGDAVAWGQQRVFDAGITGPEGHAMSRPAVVEGEATGRAVRLSRLVGVPLYVVHVMSIDAMEEVAAARQAGQRVLGETVASAIALDESRLWDANYTVAAQFVMSPPIRSAVHRERVKKALASGTLSVLGTDHAVFNSTQKAAGRHDFRIIPNGVNGIEERMHVAWEVMVNSALANASAFVRMTSAAAAQAFNMYPRKGAILVGSDADVIVLDPALRHTIRAASHHSRMDTNVYEGMEVTGKVVVTISQGRVVWRDGHLNVTPGTGRYIPLAPFGQAFLGVSERDDMVAWTDAYGATPVVREGDGDLAAAAVHGGGSRDTNVAAAAAAAAAVHDGAALDKKDEL